MPFNAAYTPTGPELSCTINFTTTGTYYVWLRGYALNAAGDSLYLALDDQPVMTMTGFAPNQWTWTSQQISGAATGTAGVATINVTEPGFHTLHIWQREDGLRLVWPTRERHRFFEMSRQSIYALRIELVFLILLFLTLSLFLFFIPDPTSISLLFIAGVCALGTLIAFFRWLTAAKVLAVTIGLELPIVVLALLTPTRTLILFFALILGIIVVKHFIFLKAKS